MKLFVLLSVLSVSALVAANPVALHKEVQNRADRVVHGSFDGWFSSTRRFGIQEDYVITAFTITRVSGVATWAQLDGGVGSNFVSIRVTQPFTIPLSPRYYFEYEIRGQPQTSTL
ncbi:unnamed protein product [Diatraea saccharalis]|uniref:Uncharacterized protein n=1 Tax=Diatraea saccharalis TaxID=40085 RepID=A0A9P0G3C8_9NEOP|nr:unnamed protein product [Diatraea saccharalis]